MALDEPHAIHYWTGGSFRDPERVEWINEDYEPLRARTVTPAHRRALSDMARRIPAEQRSGGMPRARNDDPLGSHTAARAAALKLGHHKAIALDIINRAGEDGMTPQEVADRALADGAITLREHDTIRRRVSDLYFDGLIASADRVRGHAAVYLSLEGVHCPTPDEPRGKGVEGVSPTSKD